MVSGNLTQSSGWDIFVLSDLWMRPDHDKILQLIPEGMLCSTMRETRVNTHTQVGIWLQLVTFLCHPVMESLLQSSALVLLLSHAFPSLRCPVSLQLLLIIICTCHLVLSHFNNVPTGGFHCLCPVGRLALGLWVFPKERSGQGQGGTN